MTRGASPKGTSCHGVLLPGTSTPGAVPGRERHGPAVRPANPPAGLGHAGLGPGPRSHRRQTLAISSDEDGQYGAVVAVTRRARIRPGLGRLAPELLLVSNLQHRAWDPADRRVHFMTDEEPAYIRIVRDRLVYANRYGELYDDDVEFRPGGVRGRYVRWQWRSMYSVAVLALADPSTALLVRNFRHSARREVIEAVKGFGDDGRPPVEVARHELREELGFTATGLTFLGKAVADPGFADHPVHCFLATGKVDGPPHPEDSEAIRGIARFPIAQTAEALASGRIEDAVTLLLLWQACELERKGTGSARDTPVPDAGRSH